MSKQKIGVFSGTFDPVHIGHVESCLVAIGALELESVVIFLEKKPHRKENVASFYDRANMLELAIQDYPKMRIVDIGSENITTKNTLEYFDNHFESSEYWYILGSDTLSILEDWDDSDLLFERMNMCVVLRKNSDEKKVTKLIRHLKSKYRGTKFTILPAVWSEVSSSKEKVLLHSGKKPDGLDEKVLDYIKSHKLYES